MNKVEHLLQGGIHIETNFFPIKIYTQIKKKINTIKMNSTYQPAQIIYGNRLQAMPCYEKAFNFQKKNISDKIEKLLNVKIWEYNCIARKIKTEELKNSKCKGKFGFIHQDNTPSGLKDDIHLAAVLHFDQSFDGGTAFFENFWDKTPDIYISAYPNRLVLYNACRWHAAVFDYTFKERTSLVLFFKVKNEDR